MNGVVIWTFFEVHVFYCVVRLTSSHHNVIMFLEDCGWGWFAESVTYVIAGLGVLEFGVLLFDPL